MEDMRVNVNCKKAPINYVDDYRSEFKDRILSAKTFPMRMSYNYGVLTLSQEEENRSFTIAAKNVGSLVFYLEQERTYAEVVVTNGQKTLSFTLSPDFKNVELGIDGVLNFKDMLDALAESDGFECRELIDPNPLNIVPDEFDSMDDLQRYYDDEMARIAKEKAAAEFMATAPMPPVSFPVIEFGEDDGFEDEPLVAVAPEAPAVAVAEEPASASEEMLDSALEQIEKVKDDLIEERTRHAQSNLDMANIGLKEPVDTSILYSEINDEAEQVKASVSDVIAQKQAEDEAFRQAAAEAETKAEASKPPSKQEQIADAVRSIEESLTDFERTLLEERQALQEARQNTAVVATERASLNDAEHNPVIAGLIGKLAEQNERNSELERELTKERSISNHYSKLLKEAEARHVEQNTTIDDLNRQLKFGMENQRRSAQFVQDTREEVKKILAETDEKIAASLAQVEDMRKAVNQAEFEKADAVRRMKQAIKICDDKEKELQAAIDRNNEEAERSIQATRDIESKLDTFTENTMLKIQEEINRAADAEAARDVTLMELENARAELLKSKEALAEAKAVLDAKDEDFHIVHAEVVERDKQISRMKEEYAKLEETYNTLFDQHQNFTSRYEELVLEREQLTEEKERAISEKNGLISSVAAANAAAARAEAKVVEAEMLKTAAMANVSFSDPAQDKALQEAQAECERYKNMLQIEQGNSQTLLSNIQTIMQQMPDTLGYRKKKLEMIDEVLADYIQASNANLGGAAAMPPVAPEAAIEPPAPVEVSAADNPVAQHDVLENVEVAPSSPQPSPAPQIGNGEDRLIPVEIGELTPDLERPTIAMPPIPTSSIVFDEEDRVEPTAMPDKSVPFPTAEPVFPTTEEAALDVEEINGSDLTMLTAEFPIPAIPDNLVDDDPVIEFDIPTPSNFAKDFNQDAFASFDAIEDKLVNFGETSSAPTSVWPPFDDVEPKPEEGK